MAEFKKAIEKTLKPFARKVGSDIKSIESKVFTGKAINAVEFGIDNTGATDVTAKLNELFQKVHAENYTEVIFPDGTYRIDGKVNVIIPSDRKRYINIHAQNRYKAVFELHGSRTPDADGTKFIGFQLMPENFEVTTTRGYNVRFDGFIFNSHELPADGSNTQTQTIYGIFTSQETHGSFNMSDYKLYNLTCTNLEFNGGYYALYLYSGLFDSEFKNIKVDGMQYCIDMNSQYSNNNKVENITIRNCENGMNIASKASIKNIDIIQDDESIIPSLGNSHNLTGYTISNISYKGYYDMSSPNDVLMLNCTAGCTISDIRLDLKPVKTDHIYIGSVPSFIYVTSTDSEADIINISSVSFDTFEEKFADVFEKVDTFALFNTQNPVSMHNVNESAHLKYFQDKAVNFVYDKTGSMTESYNTLNESFISRPYLGTDRNMNGTGDSDQGKFAALYLATSEGTPLSARGTDYSENTAGVKGDIFTDISPEVNGHFAYVSTYVNTKDTSSYPKSTIASFAYNEEDKSYTATFTDLPKFQNGTMKDRVVNVGSIIQDIDSGTPIEFEITAVDEDIKTLTLKPNIENKEGYVHPYSINGTTHEYVFSYGYKLKPRKVNRMKNMTYVTVPIIHSGPTENRPTEHVVTGQMYFDTTLGTPVFWNGTEWIKGNNGAEVDTSSLATKEEIKAIPAANITQDDNHYFVTKYQQAKLGNLYNRGEFDKLFTKKTELEGYATKAEMQQAIAAIPAPTVDTSNLVTKEELNTTLTAINEKLKELRGGSH